MTILAGPALSFQGIDATDTYWQVSVLLVEKGDSAMAINVTEPAGGNATGPITLLQRGDGTAVRRHDLSVPLGGEERQAVYTLDGKQYAFIVPAKGASPRMAYGSCNGFSSERLRDKYDHPDGEDEPKNADANWLIMHARHIDKPYHLLVQGGDQVYADSLRPLLKNLRRQQKWSRQELLQQDGADVQKLLDDFYFDLYLERWQDTELRPLLAQIPAVSIWDDHDIIDGWGSLGEIQETRLYKAMFATANRYFQLFQRHQAEHVERAAHYLTQGGHTLGLRLGRCALLVLDLRSERTMERVMADASWTETLAWLDQLEADARAERQLEHLFVISSIPVLHPSFHALESALGILPGRQGAEDDLRDHWTSRAHQDERVRMVKRLLSFADGAETCVTIVSGDVHVAAHGLIESTRRAQRRPQDVMHQLTSSGIVHPPPPGIVMFGLNRLLEDDQQIDTFVHGKMQLFKGIERRFIGARNWLSIEPNRPGDRNPADVYVKWYIEDVAEPCTVVIEGPQRQAQA
jgi:hypothetical protein